MLSDAIDAVDWSAVPAPPNPRYRPEVIADSLKELATATTLDQVADAASRLAGGGIVHDHSGMVFPSASRAAPLLLGIMAQGHPRARAAAVGLLDDALRFHPLAGYNRVATEHETHVPICCAVARSVRSRRDVVLAQGRPGKGLLTEARLHWRFDIEEALPVSEGVVAAFGVLEGVLPSPPVGGELHAGPARFPVPTVETEYPPADDTGQACLLLKGVPAEEAVAGSALHPAACGEREH
ncbi:hypothetical protein F0L17_10110 [Streptomyces sp. TRM43335]|uniref:Uncharacterized protein n=1 Tax=Streptomyces taklimakanensis TaxID=2569853 RepID=A0A6G2BC42_9ACTN|nr:hypothetical protein [Streptomyces taklimakanensis]MTE19472.1 hypothetical protein [Streptomyces taklimakanensis]